jgi:hypothetical protein
MKKPWILVFYEFYTVKILENVPRYLVNSCQSTTAKTLERYAKDEVVTM